jgi:hypothetical protein
MQFKFKDELLARDRPKRREFFVKMIVKRPPSKRLENRNDYDADKSFVLNGKRGK